MKTVQMFRLTGSGLQPMAKKPSLPMYSRIFFNGWGHDCTPYAIITDADERGQQKAVAMSNYWHDYHYIDSYCRPISQLFGIGTYWDDKEPDFRFSEDEVKKYIKLADKEAEIKAKEASDKAEADRKDISELPARFPHLTPINDRYDNKEAKKNLVSDLKHNFPGVKFSVRCDHYDTYYVSWVNGPTREEVCKITGKFEDHENDITGDFRDYSPSNFNRVFGGFKYVFETREHKGFEELEKKFFEMYQTNDSRDKEIDFGRLLHTTSFPVGAKNFNIVRTDATCGDVTDFFKITFEADIKTQSQLRTF